jgi:NTE family protein
MDADPPAPPSPPNATALLLTGGGARAAYQVGVLEAIAELRKVCGAQGEPNPFPIVAGTSAGAINAAALACGADDFDAAVHVIARVWRNFHAHQVYRVDPVSMLRSGAQWMTLLSLGWLVARWRRLKPKSMLDNTPLAELLTHMLPLERIPQLISSGHLQALAVTASSYSTGEHITFFEGDKRLTPWVRSQRRAVRDKITHQHLLASSAIPFAFPAMPLRIEGETGFFGDGSMRQSAPVAPAIHLGAQRVLVVGAGRLHERKPAGGESDETNYPTLAQIAGHALANIFLDSLSVDVERLLRINQTLRLVPPELREASNLRQVDVLMISPSQRLDDIASRHIYELPHSVLSLLGGVGVSAHAADIKGAALASYLLFEQGYTRELMALGHADAMRQRQEICRFFSWTDPAPPQTASRHLPPNNIERRRDPLRLR